MTPAEHAEVIRQALVEGASDWKIADQSLAALVAQAEDADHQRERANANLTTSERIEERAERAEAALRESAITYHRHMQHPRDFEVCTWKPCRIARAALDGKPQ